MNRCTQCIHCGATFTIRNFLTATKIIVFVRKDSYLEHTKWEIFSQNTNKWEHHDSPMLPIFTWEKKRKKLCIVFMCVFMCVCNSFVKWKLVTRRRPTFSTPTSIKRPIYLLSPPIHPLPLGENDHTALKEK